MICTVCGKPTIKVGDPGQQTELLQTMCANPRCEAAGILTDSARARIVIEQGPDLRVRTTWWRSDDVSAWEALALCGYMLEQALAILSAGLTTALGNMAKRN